MNTTSTFIGNINPFRYKGYYYDKESNMYYCKSRYYNPEWCRWLNADSVAYLDLEYIDGMNLFAYCGNNPVMGMDPMGHFFITAMLIGAGIGALVGVASQGASDVLSNLWNHGFTTSEWKFSSWQTYVGAAVGGAVGGALTPFLGPVSTAAINGAVSSLVGMGLENATGATNYSAGDIFATSLFVASFSGMTAGSLDRRTKYKKDKYYINTVTNLYI